MQNLFKIWFRRKLGLTDWLIQEAYKNGFKEIEIDCENQIVYFKDHTEITVFSPLVKKKIYVIREDATIMKGAFKKNDTVLRELKDKSRVLVRPDEL